MASHGCIHLHMAGVTAAPARDRAPADTERARTAWRQVASRDGTSIGWLRTDPHATSSANAVPVVLCNGIACSVDYWTTLAHRLGGERPVLQWDYRGHGVSGIPTDPEAVTIDDVMDDLDTVLRAADVPRAVFVGHSFGVQVVLEAARRWPERVAGVVAIAGSPGAPLPPRATRPLTVVERLHQRMPARADEAWRLWWTSPLMHLAARAMGGTSVAAPRQVMLAYYEHVSTRDVPLLLAMMRAMQDHDASDVPATLDVPVLALAGDADRLTPLPVMARIALHAPRGELAVCHGGTHTLPAEHPDWVLDQLRPLLRHIDATQRHIDLPAGA